MEKKTCQEISLPTSFKIFISIILGTNLAISGAAMLGGLRTEKIFRNNNKKKLNNNKKKLNNKILFQEFNLTKKLQTRR